MYTYAAGTELDVEELLGVAKACELRLSTGEPSRVLNDSLMYTSAVPRNQDSWSGGRHNSWRSLVPEYNAPATPNLYKLQKRPTKRPSSACVTRAERTRFLATNTRADRFQMPASFLSVSRMLQHGWKDTPERKPQQLKPKIKAFRVPINWNQKPDDKPSKTMETIRRYSLQRGDWVVEYRKPKRQ